MKLMISLRKIINIWRILGGKTLLWSFLVAAGVFFFLISIPITGFYAIQIPNLYGNYEPESEDCTPKRHIMYLKTHKCASTAIQNIFLRYGYENNLSFALPSSGNYLGSPGFFKESLLPKALRPASGLVDVFCTHSRFDQKELGKILHSDTVWLTSIRNPVSQFESLYEYFHLDNQYNSGLLQLKENYKQVEEKATRENYKFGRNQMLFDLGGKRNISVQDLREKLEELDRAFDLVLVSERMDESLVLLRHELCWSLKDVVVFIKNTRRERKWGGGAGSSSEDLTLPEHVVKEIKRLNSADEILYDHFLSRHKERVSNFGQERMDREVSALRELTAHLYDQCVSDEVGGKDDRLGKQFKEYSGLVSGFVLRNHTHDYVCESMTMPELRFIDLVRQRQRAFIDQKLL